MSSPVWLNLERALADTGIFILWYRGEPNAKLFFRNPKIEIYYSRMTRNRSYCVRRLAMQSVGEY